MRYDEMMTIYPKIEDLFSQAAEYCHDEQAGPEMALGWAERWIARHISPEHREDVFVKARRFINAVRES